MTTPHSVPLAALCWPGYGLPSSPTPDPAIVELIRVLIRTNVADVDVAFGVLSAEDRSSDDGDAGFPPNVEAMRRVLAAQEAYIDQMKIKERGQLVEIEKLNTSLERKSRFLADLKLSHRALHVATLAELDRVRSGKEDRDRARAVVGRLETEVDALKKREQELKQDSKQVHARLKPATKIFSNLTSKLSAMNADAEAARARLAAVDAERDDLDRRATECASAVEEARRRTEAADGEREGVMEELEFALGELASARAAHADAEEMLQAAKAVQHASEMRVAEANARKTKADETCTMLHNQCTMLHDQCAVLHNQCDDAEELLLCHERRLEHIHEGVDEVGRRRKAAEADLNGRISELAKTMRKVTVFKQKIASARSHLVSLYREMADVESDIASTRRALHVKGERAMHALVATM